MGTIRNEYFDEEEKNKNRVKLNTKRLVMDKKVWGFECQYVQVTGLGQKDINIVIPLILISTWNRIEKMNGQNVQGLFQQEPDLKEFRCFYSRILKVANDVDKHKKILDHVKDISFLSHFLKQFIRHTVFDFFQKIKYQDLEPFCKKPKNEAEQIYLLNFLKKELDIAEYDCLTWILDILSKVVNDKNELCISRLASVWSNVLNQRVFRHYPIWVTDDEK